MRYSNLNCSICKCISGRINLRSREVTTAAVAAAGTPESEGVSRRETSTAAVAFLSPEKLRALSPAIQLRLTYASDGF